MQTQNQQVQLTIYPLIHPEEAMACELNLIEVLYLHANFL
ncbi:hypothetical protein BX604_4942 [Burkholderia sp. JKS000303]|nr:hypothetical protein BX604_4942 [Burkholderia sp. JKS000303]